MAKQVPLCLEASQIHSIMENMSYEQTGVINLSVGKKWLEDKQYCISSISGTDCENQHLLKNYAYEKNIKVSKLTSKICETLLLNLEKAKTGAALTCSQRSAILLGISSALQKNTELLSQINLIAKGISIKDTKNKDIPIMIDFFQYYACWANVIDDELSNWSAYGNTACIFPEYTSLCMLAWALAPSFAAGNRTIIFAEVQMIPLVQLLKEICISAGMPPEYLFVVYSEDRYNIEQMSLFKSPQINKVAYFGDKEGAKTLRYGLGGFPKEITLCTGINSKCPMIIFDDTDLDSVCDVIIDAVWSHLGQLPWSLNTVFVQENIYCEFEEKIKRKLDKLIVGSLTSSCCDVNVPNNFEYAAKLNSLIDKANDLGISYYQAPTIVDKNELFTPTAFFGNRVEMNHVLTDDDDTPALTVLSFRTASEGARLANNTKFGMAASVWTNNDALSRGISKHLEAGIIWINSYGDITPRASICPYKESGVGYFGGKEGLLCYMKFTTWKEIDYYNEYHSPEKEDSLQKKEVVNKVQLAKKAYNTWSTVSSNVRCNALRKFANEIEKKGKYLLTSARNRGDFENTEEWIRHLHKNASLCQLCDTHSFEECLSLTTLLEPVGTVVVDSSGTSSQALQLILTAIANGNSVILILPEISFASEIISLMSSCGFPQNVLTVIKSDGYLKTLIEHHDVQAIFYEFCDNLTRKYRARYVDWRSVFNLKGTFMFSPDNQLPMISLQMLLSKKKTIIRVPLADSALN